MTIFSVVLKVACLVLALTIFAHGYILPKHSSKSATQLGFAGKPDNKKAGKKTPSAPETKEKKWSLVGDFVFLYGRPEINWVTGKVMTEAPKRRHNWLVKPDE